MAWKKVWQGRSYKWVKDIRWEHGGTHHGGHSRDPPRAAEDNREREGPIGHSQASHPHRSSGKRVPTPAAHGVSQRRTLA
eukprot:2605727-Alexandrium_andersonii.AAC.1